MYITVDKNCKVIEESLNTDLKKIANWFSYNNLILNLKKGKQGMSFMVLHKDNKIIEINHRYKWSGHQ